MEELVEHKKVAVIRIQKVKMMMRIFMDGRKPQDAATWGEREVFKAWKYMVQEAIQKATSHHTVYSQEVFWKHVRDFERSSKVGLAECEAALTQFLLDCDEYVKHFL